MILGNFFCSNSPFDSTTSLGSDILKDQDSLLTVFDGEICETSLFLDPADSSVSFLDMTGEKQSGINSLTPHAIGTWDNLSSIAYFKFNAESFDSLLNDTNEFHSLSFDFSTDTNTSSSVEIGFCNDKSNNEKINRDSLWEIVHLQFDNAAGGNYSKVINEGYIDSSDTSIIWKATSYKHTHGYIQTIETKVTPDYIKDCNIAITVLHPLGKDTVVKSVNLDTIITFDSTVSIFDTTYDTTSYNLGYVIYKDTTIQMFMRPKESIVYDSIIPVVSLVKDGQNVFYSFSLQPDTLFDSLIDTLVKAINFKDSLVTTLDTTANHTINKKVIQIIQNGVTIEKILSDTVYSLITITQDTILQISTISPQITYTNHFSDEILTHYDTLENGTIVTVKDTITNLCFYAKLDSVNDNSVQFIRDVHLTYTSLKRDAVTDTIEDTVTSALYPSYFDYSVFENSTTPHDFTDFVTGAAGRYVRMALNMKPLRDKVLDSNGGIVYKNIPKAVMTIFPDSLLLHKSAGTSVNSQYILSTEKTTDIDKVLYNDDRALYQLSSAISTATDSLDIQLHAFLINLLYSENKIPETCYLYLGIFSNNFAHLNWKKPATGFPITFIVSDSQ